jgi:hypothetical protein
LLNPAFYSQGYVTSVLGTTRSISKKEAQDLASALRANYSRMFGSMIRKFKFREFIDVPK